MKAPGKAAFVAVLVGLVAACTGRREARVTIDVETEVPVPSGDTVFVAGSHESVGTWRPDGRPLSRADSTTWHGSLELPAGTRFEFKITRGTWPSEALGPDGSVPGNRTALVIGDTTIHVAVSGWKDESDFRAGQITGDVEYLRGLRGEGIPARDVIVWLPPGYTDHTGHRYPVLYAHDGQNLFDPATSYTGFDWRIDEVADSLSRHVRMKEIIVVGIYNTVMRSEEYGDTEAGRAYLDFLVGTLKPMIDSTYRTLPDARHTAIMGSSAGGTISFLALWYHPDVFSRAACLSPYFPPGLPIRVAESGWNAEGLSLYIDNGDDELDTRLQSGIDAMLPALRNTGFEEGRNMVWYRAVGAEHNERAWARRVWRPLVFLFGGDGGAVIR